MLRQARRPDVAAMQRIRRAVKENRLVSIVISDSDVIHAMEDTGRGWVVEKDGEIVGFGIANRENRSIWAIFIDPDQERQGFGRQLLDAMTAWLWGEGSDPIWLTTEPGTRAERFYAEAGWKRTGMTSSGEIRFELERCRTG